MPDPRRLGKRLRVNLKDTTWSKQIPGTILIHIYPTIYYHGRKSGVRMRIDDRRKIMGSIKAVGSKERIAHFKKRIEAYLENTTFNKWKE